MSLEKAFSLEMEIDITATKADELYNAGFIKSKFTFKCPEPDCEAQVTCANLDKPKIKRKKDPYFVFVSEHSSNCPLKAIRSYGKPSTYSDDFSDEVYVANSIKLNLATPSNKNLEVNSNLEYESESNYFKAKPNSYGSGKRKLQKTKTLSSMIDSFLAKDNFIVDTPDGTLELKYFF